VEEKSKRAQELAICCIWLIAFFVSDNNREEKKGFVVGGLG
jgi:hypothetical protein